MPSETIQRPTRPAIPLHKLPAFGAKTRGIRPSTSTLHRHRLSGKLKTFPIGGRQYVEIDEARRYFGLPPERLPDFPADESDLTADTDDEVARELDRLGVR